MHAAAILLSHAIVISGRDWPVEDYPPNRWPPRLARPASAAELVATLDALLAQVDEVVTRLSDSAWILTLPAGRRPECCRLRISNV
jgi:hypothetical protein